MDVRCDRCETEYELDDAIVTDAGASVQCTTCGHTFIVTRRPSSPLHHMGLTPPGGTSEPSGPEVPEWTLSTDDGKVHRFRDLIVLQKWIVERKVSRNERISRGGGPWLALEDVVELTPFFKVVDEADRARASTGIPGGMPTAPTFRAPSGGWSTTVPAPRSPSGPHRAGEGPPRPAGTPPPVPFDARRSISEDGPTVPNRRLPAEIANAFGQENELPLGAAPPPVLPVIASAPPPALAPRPLPGMRDSQPVRTTGSGGNGPRSTDGQLSSSSSPSSLSSSSSSGGTSGRSPRSAMSSSTANAAAAAMAASANEGIRRAGAAAPRSPSTVGGGHNITAETHPLERELLMPPSHGNRNALVVAVVMLLVAAGGGAWLWQKRREQIHPPERESAAATPGVLPGGGRPLVAPSPTAEGPAAVAKTPAATTGSGSSDNSAKPSDENSGSRKQAEGAASAPTTAAATPPTTRAKGGDANQGSAHPAPRAGRSAADLSAGRTAAEGGAPAAGSYDRLVTEADRLLERGKTAKADNLYTQALAARPDGVSALTGAGYVLLDRQRHFKAIETFRRALAIQPTFGPALFGIAESYRARGDTAQALGAYRQYLAITPTGSDAPAARRQIKDLEAAGTAPASSGDESVPRQHAAPDLPAADRDTN